MISYTVWNKIHNNVWLNEARKTRLGWNYGWFGLTKRMTQFTLNWKKYVLQHKFHFALFNLSVVRIINSESSERYMSQTNISTNKEKPQYMRKTRTEGSFIYIKTRAHVSALPEVNIWRKYLSDKEIRCKINNSVTLKELNINKNSLDEENDQSVV